MPDTAPLHEITGTIGLGADVYGPDDDKIGEVSHIIVDARSDLVTDIVVKHGMLFKDETVVPLRYIASTGEDGVRLNIDKDGFDDLGEYDAAAYRAPDPDYMGPPSDDVESKGMYRNTQMDAIVAFGPYAAYGTIAPTGGYPGGERNEPNRIARPVIGEGTDIVSSDGEKVGEVAELLVDARDGELARLYVKQGFIFKSEREIPVSWVQDLSDQGVILNVPQEQVESLFSGQDVPLT